ncbi:MAG: methyltransferase domain-containing protein [Chitinophagaceae bacterium]
MKPSPFDIAAETYDKDFTHSLIGQMQRKRVWQFLMPLLQSYQRPLNILEINCGTGEDALQLAKLGHNVTAMDASEQMILKAKQKKPESIVEDKLPRFITSSFSQIADYDFKKPFDLVISNFGGLNCVDENDIRLLSKNLSHIVTTNGTLFLVVMSRSCLWEMLYYSLKGRFNKAFRRLQRSIPFRLHEHVMQIFYYAPRQLTKLFLPAFTRVQTQPVGLFIPPSYLETTFAKRLTLLKALNQWEIKFGFPFLSSLADHYCVILKKQPQA